MKRVTCCFMGFLVVYLSSRLVNQKPHEVKREKDREKGRCSGSFRLAVGFLVIKDDSISERPS